MIPKKHRLSKHAEVTKTTAKGRSFFSQSFIIKYLPLGIKSDSSKITFIASVKVSKTAVARNRVKRILREAIKPYINKLKPAQYAVIIKKSATLRSPKDLKTEIELALQKARLLLK